MRQNIALLVVIGWLIVAGVFVAIFVLSIAKSGVIAVIAASGFVLLILLPIYLIMNLRRSCEIEGFVPVTITFYLFIGLTLLSVMLLVITIIQRFRL